MKNIKFLLLFTFLGRIIIDFPSAYLLVLVLLNIRGFRISCKREYWPGLYSFFFLSIGLKLTLNVDSSYNNNYTKIKY